MSGRMTEPPDYAAFAARIIRSLGVRVADADPESLVLFVELRKALTAAEDVAVAGLRKQGFTMAELARPLHITKQAVFYRLQAAEARS